MAEAFIIAVDGPAASGKGTLSRRLASLYGLRYLDTGRLYRGVAWLMLQQDLDPRNVDEAKRVAEAFDPSALDTAALRTSAVGRAASLVAVHHPVRQALYDFQRNYGLAPPGAVLDGRDIGTVIFPDATVKLFITADIQERARRRFEELKIADGSLTYENVLAELKRRDARDQGRDEAPLTPAADAELIDTSKLAPDEVMARAARVVDNIRRARGVASAAEGS